MSPESSSSMHSVYANIYDSLVEFGPDFQILPSLAEKWEFRPAQNAWRFTIRKDVKFSDGTPLTGEDVAWTVNTIIEKKWPQKGQIPSATEAKLVDPFTVDILSKTPDVSILNGGPWIWVLPKAYYEKAGKDGFTAKPVGSGPYQLADFKPADQIRFTKRTEPHAFRRPIATEIIFRAIPDISQQINGLRTGDLDLAASAFTADQADQLKKAGITVLYQLSSNTSALFSQPEMEARQTPLRDKRVRLALNYAVDKVSMAASIYKGFAEAAGQIGSPGGTYFDPAVKPLPYDVAQAKRLLAEAGYPNGFKLPVGIEYTSGSTTSTDLVLAVQSALKEVGVEAEVKQYEFAAFLDKYYGRNGQQKGDIFFQGLGDFNGMFSLGRGLYDCDKTGFEIWWCNREFIRFYDQAMQEPDLAKRTDLMRKGNAAFREDVPVIFLMTTSQFLVHTPKVKDVKFPVASSYRFDSAYKID